jgi:uncharacterized protein YfaS (alpha-2-macroglobulin family)
MPWNGACRWPRCCAIYTARSLTRGRTEYKVTFKAGLKDVFGQTLEKDTTVTFKVDSADPMLSAPAGNWVVLDPSGKNAYSVYSMNFADLRIRLLAVGPDDYRQYLDYLNEWDPKKDTPPGRLLSDQTIRVKSEPDVLTETAIDLTPALKEGRGQVLVVVEPGSGLTELFSRRNRPRIKAWVQATRIGLDVFADPRNLVVRATSLVDGSPLAGVQVQGWPVSPSVITGPDGLARLPLSSYDEAAMKLVVGALGPDRAVLRQTAYSYGSGGFQAQPVKDTLRWYVVDDRQMYRPGEEVRIKGWIRREGGGPDGDLGLFDRSQKRIHYDVLGPQGNEITKGQVEVGPYGGFDLKIDLPKNMNLGTAQLRLSAPGGQGDPLGWNHQHEFQVQEFRRPEFEVTAQAEAGPFVLGGSANVEVKAAYYAGGGLPNAEVTWEVRSRSASYSPPGWSAFIFGRWLPWWLDRDESGEGGLDSYQGVTDPGGTHRLKLDFLVMAEPFPQSLDAEATVMDVNRQAWTASRLLLVHPSEYYVGLKPDRTFVQAGEPFHLDVVVSDLDGKAVPGQLVNLKAVRLGWVYKNGRYLEEEAEVATGTVTSAAKPVPFDFRLAKGGTYQVTAEVADGKKRLNRTQMTAWVAGGDRPLARNVEQESAMLIPDKEEYQAGETAEILVQTPFWPAEGLVSWRRSGILKTETIRLTGPSYTLKVPIEEAFVPNLNVDVDLVGAAPRVNAQGVQDASLPKRPAFAKGRVDLKVPPRKRTLTLDVAPQDKDLEPGGQTVVNVKLTDSSGKPVAGEVAVAVVDEAVLALTGHRWPDPIRLLYPDRSPLVEEVHTRSDIILAKPEAIEPEEPDSGNKSVRMTGAEPEAMYDMAMAPPMPSAMAAPGGGVAGPPAPAIRVRIDFNALAVFSPAVPTDGSGRAQIKVKLPDSLTRYRIMAVAAAGENRFGLGEAGLRARLPLMVRPSAPRFLNFGDQFELPVTLQNQTGKPMRVGVALRATHLELTDGNGREVDVPADNRVEVRFPARTLGAGTGRFQVAAASGGSADGAQGEIPVLTPATTEAAATYGEIDDGVMVQPVAFPQNVFTGFGGLDITTSSTALGALTDAFLYLVAYPFDCSEQVASRVLSVAALRDVLTAFKAEGLPPKAELDQAMARDIERLAGLQNSDGGFPIWRRGEESWPYHSIHGAHALARAKAKGYAVPQPVLDRSLQYLRNIENNIPRDYGESSRRTLIAYALYVRTHLKDPDRAGARKLIDKAGLEKLHPEAIGWLLYVLAGDKGSEKTLETIHRHLQNRVTETAGAAQFTTGYDDGGGHVLLHSDRRTDGIVLEALIQDQPKNDLIPKLVHGLMAHRKKGRWLNTQENVFILLALDRYFAVYEAAEPDFVARVWLGDQFAGQSTFKGRSPDQARVRVPMARLAEVKKAPVLIQKDGPGRLYYRLGLNYAPQNLWLAAADYGFAVEREYEAVDDPKDVTRTKDGYQVKAGARVRVKLTMVAPARRYHVALIDPLPAGFEALNPALAVTGTQPVGEAAEMRTRYWWWGPWYEHQNLRDSRAEAFTTYLWDGVYTYTYIARATTPGAFVAPPAKAEEMYAPETFGRSASDRVTVVD